MHPTLALEADASQKDKEALESMAHDHTCFICAVRIERLIGISRLDKIVPFESMEKGIKTTIQISLRIALLNYLELPDNRSVIAIHQRGSDDPYVVVSNESEVESPFLRLNHQLPAFLLHYLPAQHKMPTEYVQKLLKASCEPALFNDAFKCTWDDKEWIVTRPDEEKLKAAREKEERENQWYKGFVNMHLLNEQPTEHVAPEARYDLDGERSVNTIHHSDATKTTKARKNTRAKSVGDSNSRGDVKKMDSASTNASRKPYSKVGFDDENSLGDSSQSSSSEEDSSISGDDSQSSSRKGGGG